MNKSKAISRIERILRKLKDGTFTDSDIDVLFVTARELPTATKNILKLEVLLLITIRGSRFNK
jgi:hypothetical protein